MGLSTKGKLEAEKIMERMDKLVMSQPYPEKKINKELGKMHALFKKGSK
tara:strand:- start:174 stop:320 length:147 start_codon:yes stop_codon:yes gene_type:complete